MAWVKGTNNSETINLFDGVTFGDDVIWGYGGNDSIFGLAGDDFLHGGEGADALHGGPGSDTASYVDSAAGIMASLSYGVGAGGEAEGDTYFSIENLFGSLFADALVGNDGNNRLDGLAGDDFLDGRDGTDMLLGGSGNDTLKGGGGADWLDGNEGIDTVSYYESPEGVIALLGNEGAYGDAEGDTFIGIENLTGSIYDDILWGDDGVNKLMGMDGADVLRGLDGNDTLDGGAGADRMLGGPGGDTYYVDNGADEIIEVGNQGADQVLTSVSYSLAPGLEVEMLGTTDRGATTAISLAGNEYANRITGNAGVNVIVGGAGLDTMFGGDGGDIFVGIRSPRWAPRSTPTRIRRRFQRGDRRPDRAQSDRRRRQRRERRHRLHVHRRCQQSVHGGRPGQLAHRRGRHLHPAQHRRRCRSRWSDPGARRAGSRCELVRSLTVRVSPGSPATRGAWVS